MALVLRQIAKVLSMTLDRFVSYQIVNQWVEKEYKKTQNDIEKEVKVPESIEIIEMDELYTYVKKTKSNQNMDCY